MSRNKIKKIIEWHEACLREGFPVNFVPLIVGPSGSGKTYTIENQIQEVAKKSDYLIPFFKVDATAYTAKGWEGPDLDEQIAIQVKEYCQEHDARYEDALSSAIIYIDEIDKVLMSGGHAGSDVGNKTQQFQLLTLLQPNATWTVGPKYQPSKAPSFSVSCAQILFIFSGAFEPVFYNKMAQSKSIGFSSTPTDFSQKALYDQEVTWEDLKGSGGVPELLNRMNVLVQTKPYTEKELAEMYNKSWDKAFVEKYLCKPVDPKEVVDYAVKAKSGARGLNKFLYQDALKRTR
jgi:ATP-dependent protease Clp ATPase subunit